MSVDHYVYLTCVYVCFQGSDPLIQTARGKLQTKRSKLNDQINRELLMRKGAENLFRWVNIYMHMIYMYVNTCPVYIFRYRIGIAHWRYTSKMFSKKCLLGLSSKKKKDLSTKFSLGIFMEFLSSHFFFSLLNGMWYFHQNESAILNFISLMDGACFQ